MKKHIVCFGDSNTHGYCADPNDTADHTDRFTEDERWTCLLQKALGEDYLVLEEGLSGRNPRDIAYGQMYCVYEQESGLFLGTGYYCEEEKTLKADKIFVTRQEL